MLLAYKGVAHPWLADVMGHMTTRHYVAMFDDASYHLLYEVFGWSGDSVATDGLGWADVKHVIEYQGEVGTGDILEISGGLRKVGGKSITVFYEMRNLTRGELAATLESTSVLFDTRARKAIPLSDEMREKATQQLIPEA
ncbi:MAG: thioesterase family protein [Halioglobus sp.]